MLFNTLTLSLCSALVVNASPLGARDDDTNLALARAYPSFDELPLDPEGGYKNAWGLWKPELAGLGALNHLTRERTLAAKEEIRQGWAVPLNLPLNTPDPPLEPTRKRFNHTIIPQETFIDDEIWINTQSSSHFDSLRHFPYQGSNQTWYDGVKREDIVGENATDVNGIQEFAKKGLAARGVLLDYRAWATEQGIEYSAFTTHRISLDDLKAVAEAQKVAFKPGDVLVLRTGFNEDYLKANVTEREALPTAGAFVGIDQTEEMLRWVWENKFATIVSDTFAVEAWPAREQPEGWTLHQVFLAGWGTLLGEFWDLEGLSEACRKSGHWSFFVTAEPLYIPGGVASPPNAIAIL